MQNKFAMKVDMTTLLVYRNVYSTAYQRPRGSFQVAAISYHIYNSERMVVVVVIIIIILISSPDSRAQHCNYATLLAGR